MTFEEFLKTDRVQVVLMYEYNNGIWSDTACLEDGVLYVYNCHNDTWETADDHVPFYKEIGAKVITKEHY